MLFNYILVVQYCNVLIVCHVYILLNEIFWVPDNFFCLVFKYSFCFNGGTAEVVIASLEHLRFCLFQ